MAIVRVHVESEGSNTGSTTNVFVLRSEPVVVNVSKDPILTEADLISARMLETPRGGFSLELRFEQTASWRLEQFTAINPGKHLAVFGHWGEKPEDSHWLAAPLDCAPQCHRHTYVYAGRLPRGNRTDGAGVKQNH